MSLPEKKRKHKVDASKTETKQGDIREGIQKRIRAKYDGISLFFFPPANYLTRMHVGHIFRKQIAVLCTPSSHTHTYKTLLQERLFLLLTLHLNEERGLS